MKKKLIVLFSCAVLMFAMEGCGIIRTRTDDTTEEAVVEEEQAGEVTFIGSNNISEDVTVSEGADIVYDVEQKASNNNYILPDSDTRYYTESELSGLSKDELRLARNEIYARRGRKFDSEDLQEYFGSQAWYNGTIEPADFSDSLFNDYEKANIKTIEAVENASSDTANGQNLTSQTTAGQNTTSTTMPSEFSFADIDGESFTYASGVGSWGTVITIYANGTFSGEYSDWNGGGADETHPRGEEEYCEFWGNFSEPTKINDYIYSVTVEYIDQTYETGTSEIIDGTLYDYTDPYGISVGDEFLIYMPGTPIEEVPEFYVNWIYRSVSNAPAALSYYGLYNVSEAAVF